MGAKSFRMADTSEEAKLLTVSAVLDFVREITANPTVLKQLSADAAASIDQLSTNKEKHAQALIDIQNADALHAELDEKKKALKTNAEELEVSYAVKVKQLEEQKKVHADMVTQVLDAHQRDAETLAAKEREHAKKLKELDSFKTQLNNLSAEVDRRAEIAKQTLASKTLAAERQLANREADLNKRAASLDAKAKKIEELKKALKDD